MLLKIWSKVVESAIVPFLAVNAASIRSDEFSVSLNSAQPQRALRLAAVGDCNEAVIAETEDAEVAQKPD
jgi:hypothetical protein